MVAIDGARHEGIIFMSQWVIDSALLAPAVVKNAGEAEHEHREGVEEHGQPEPGCELGELSAERRGVAAEGVA